MLTFDRADVFKSALKRVYFPHKNLIPDAVLSGVLVEQLVDELHVTAYGMDGSWIRQVIPGAHGVAGVAYLIQGSQLPRIQKIGQSKNGLALYEDSGNLQICSFSEYDAEGRPITRDTILVATIQDDLEKFSPITFLSEEVYPHFYVNEAAFSYCLYVMQTFCGFSTDQEERGIYVRIKSGMIELYGSQVFDPNYYLKATLPIASELQEGEFIICGKHLPIIQGCFNLEDRDDKPVQLILDLDRDQPRLTLKGKSGLCTLPCLSLKRNPALVRAPNNFANNPKLVPGGSRSFLLSRMAEALEIQQPGKDQHSKRVMLKPVGADLLMAKVDDYRLKEFSMVETTQVEELATSFPTLGYTVTAMQAVLSTLRTIKAKHKLNSEEIRFRTASIQIREETKWVVYAQLTELEHADYQILGIASEARQGES